MGRTVFEGQAFGGGDLVALYLLAAVGGYYVALKRSSGRFYRLRPYFGFVVTSAVVWGLGMVHALKWSIGRARPFEVLYTGLPFTPWHEIGPHFITEGIYQGSFPSGHTAQAALLLTFAYVLPAATERRAVPRAAAWAVGGLCLCFITAMGIARAMALSHWLTDVVGGLFLTWIGIQVTYHRILRLPEQKAFFLRIGRWPQAPEGWELKLSGWSVAALAGIAAAGLGARALFMPETRALALLLPAGAAGAVFALARAGALRRRAFLEMDGTDE